MAAHTSEAFLTPGAFRDHQADSVVGLPDENYRNETALRRAPTAPRRAAEPISVSFPRQRLTPTPTALGESENAHARLDAGVGRPVLMPSPAPPVTAVGRGAVGAFAHRFGVCVEIVTTSSVVLLVGVLLGARFEVMGLLAAVWAITAFHEGRAVSSPLARRLWGAARNTMPPLVAAAALGAYFPTSGVVLTAAFPAVLSGAFVLALLQWGERRLVGQLRVVVLGDGTGIAQAAARFNDRGARVVGALLVDEGPTSVPLPKDWDEAEVPVRRGFARAAADVAAWEADMVLVTPGESFSSTDLRRLQHLLSDSAVTVGVLGVLDSVAPHRVRPGWMADTTVLDVRAPRPSAFIRTVKAAVDRVLALVLLVLSVPFVIALVSAIMIDSKGSPLFRQTRVGRFGKHFTIYKFRTMVCDAEGRKTDLGAGDDADSLLFKMRSDPRVTRVGRALRKLSLDELPQLLNVLRGEMSLVGPRPFLPEETDRMGSGSMRRLAVLPGMTGLWQVSGRSDLEWDDSAWLDVYYADNWSLTGDVKILAKTLPAVLGSRGAY